MRLGLVVLTVLIGARGASGGDVELAPFAGVQFPGSVTSVAGGRPVSLGIGLDYGATADIELVPGWRAELMYSRQTTEISGHPDVPSLGLKMERYLLGIQEEKGEPPLRFFGCLADCPQCAFFSLEANLIRLEPIVPRSDSHFDRSGTGRNCELSRLTGVRSFDEDLLLSLWHGDTKNACYAD